jgi:hypothetical protein
VDEQGRIIRRLQPATLARGGRYSLEEGSGDHLPAHNSLVAPTEVVRAIGGWDEALFTWEHIDFFLRLNAICSLQAVERVMYRRVVHRSDRLSGNLPDRVDSIRRTLTKHSTTFAQHPRRRAHYLRAMALAQLRMGQWGSPLATSVRALLLAPGSAKGAGQLLATLAGPKVCSLLAPHAGRWDRNPVGPDTGTQRR